MDYENRYENLIYLLFLDTFTERLPFGEEVNKDNTKHQFFVLSRTGKIEYFTAYANDFKNLSLY